VSINLSAETFCDERFLSTVEDALATCPDLNPYYVCLEITEQGGVPENFNPKAFEKLIKLGFTMALDDYDPRQESEQARLRTFSPFISIIKLPFELMQFARTDLESLAETCRMIGDIKTLYPDIQLVMEGVRKTDNHLLGVLEAFGVDVVQIRHKPSARLPFVTNLLICLYGQNENILYLSILWFRLFPMGRKM
jgi:EAL domain-containing protein (putative c-di-GMP-specific phosphodiesterase class I)